MTVRELKIATAPNRQSAHWANQYTDKHALIAKLCNPRTINSTTVEYHALPKVKKDALKDVGGFVGGHLKDGRRRKGHVLARSLITLDLDTPPAGLFETMRTVWPFAWFATTTASHTPQNPRYRLLVWLSRDVGADEYTAIARRICEDLNPGLGWFDPTTFQPERLMYWTAVCEDGEFLFESNGKAPDLDPDVVLARFDDWRDATTWPGVDAEDVHRQQGRASTVEDPQGKQGLIGAFNRAWPIEQAIAAFLPDTYAPGVGGRYTYTGGSSANGLIIYNGVHAYSNHATDPAAGQLCNAFDLVRIHRFGHLDATSGGDVAPGRLPSYAAMVEFAGGDQRTRLENAKAQAGLMREVFAPLAAGAVATGQPAVGAASAVTIVTDGESDADAPQADPHAWVATLEVKKDGTFKDSIENFIAIFTHDPRLNHISYNEHAERLEVQNPGSLPWRQLKPGWTENDAAQLKAYIAYTYGGLYAPIKMVDALQAAATSRAFHPVRDFFDTLPPWDRTPRVDSLLIDTLGAEDSAYVRAVTRKTLVGAIRRTYQPGIKFDTVLTLVGPQGIGKSTLFAKLAGQWFSDALTISDMHDKTGAEKLLGNLIVEIAELAGMRKMDAEVVKGFISRTDDKYRAAYGRTVEAHPRQCVIVGSTNATEGFLRDTTGNRRWWAVDVTGRDVRVCPAELTEPVIQQVWAEAKHYERLGETVFLEGELAQAALDAQLAAVETDDRVGLVMEYLDKALPSQWDEMPLEARRVWLHDERILDAYVRGGVFTEFTSRQTVSKIEIWAECFGQDPNALGKQDSYAITAIMQQIPGWVNNGTQKRLPLYGKQRIFERGFRTHV